MKKLIMVPSKVKVQVRKGQSGAWIAELPEYDLHTEADHPAELEWMINDLLATYFDIPKSTRSHIWYVPERREVGIEKLPRKILMFQKFVSGGSPKLFTKCLDRLAPKNWFVASNLSVLRLRASMRLTPNSAAQKDAPSPKENDPS